MITERNRLSRLACPRRAADAMNIGLGDVRQLKIDDMADAVDVDAARRDVGCDQRPRLSATEAGQCALTLALALVAMDRGSVDARLVEGPGDAVGAVLGAGEDDDARQLGIVEQFDQAGRVSSPLQ